MRSSYDIVVIGGGHAGIEAAAVAARLGCATALVTMDAGAIGRMSCNPAIGGIGKGQIVREVDALGGVMGHAADATAVQFRMLNRSKGRAVWGPRCQSDRHAYERFVQGCLAAMPGLDVLSGEVTAVAVNDTTSRPAVRALRLADGTEIACRAAIITAGTFMRGMVHLGRRQWSAGRAEEPACAGLSDSLCALGVELGRLKTGTCARLAADSIDYDRCERQDGDAEPTPFSLRTDRLDLRQLPCWITRTNADVHRIIRENLADAPMFTGQITSVGPRYCPSIETKIERFADKDSHQLFLEPEGRDTDWVYINGLTTSLPEAVQERMIHAIEGLEDARIHRHGYAIEYDYAPPTQLDASLQTKAVAGLYLAGQVLGTTGYEEAAGLGLMAGLNAARRLGGKEPVVLGRDQGYIGVMIDDLVTKGVTEPYRMFTSRAEHRLELRADNAEDRLSPLAMELGLLDDDYTRRFAKLGEGIVELRQAVETIQLHGKTLRTHLANPAVGLKSLLEGMDRQSADAEHLKRLIGDSPRAAEVVAADCLYAGYIQRQRKETARMANLDRQRIPEAIDFAAVPHLRHEARQRLNSIRPRTLGQALRISGITPADISVLTIHLRAEKERAEQEDGNLGNLRPSGNFALGNSCAQSCRSATETEADAGSSQ